MEAEWCPQARTNGLIAQSVDSELIVIDSDRQVALSLNGPAAAVWQACDGTRGVRQLADACGMDQATVLLALGTLDADQLLETAGGDDSTSTAQGLSRRVVLTRGMMAGAGLSLAVPLISSMALPGAAMAASGTLMTFTSNGTIEVPAGASFAFAVSGGGGGGGAGGSGSGGSGGSGGLVQGTIQNAGSAKVQLQIVVGQGGGAGSPGSTSGEGVAGSSSFSPGGTGGPGNDATGSAQGAGGGGGASAIVYSAASIAVAGGGGGGGGGNTGTGASGGNANATSTSGSANSGGTAGANNGAAGGGGGGGGGSTAGIGGSGNGVTATGGTNYDGGDPTDSLIVTLATSSPNGGGAGGSPGHLGSGGAGTGGYVTVQGGSITSP